jgi:hypothetical protein
VSIPKLTKLDERVGATVWSKPSEDGRCENMIMARIKQVVWRCLFFYHIPTILQSNVRTKMSTYGQPIFDGELFSKLPLDKRPQRRSTSLPLAISDLHHTEFDDAERKLACGNLNAEEKGRYMRSLTNISHLFLM